MAVHPVAYNEQPDTSQHYLVDSHTERNKSYHVTVTPEGATCECKGYGYRGTCSHIKEVLSENPLPPQDLLEHAVSGIAHCTNCGRVLPATHVASGLCPECLRVQTLQNPGAVHTDESFHTGRDARRGAL